ncbi:TrmH family RNA methyltransferase [Metabacillus herbersteinensis]|uniref:TrmH family RNA methyltransferase n=1 Tax=Metabacillus herbersteinensis TaxID=283816 RepID=A0ABV6G983_9BACI
MNRIESVKNTKVKQWRKLHTKKEREATGTFLIEGFHLVEEALKRKEIIRELIVSEEVSLPSSWNVDDLTMTIVTTEVMKAISDTETPQGVAAICEELIPTNIDSWQKLLFVDALQDPGNLGTIIRTADAAGIDGVVLGKGTVDLYNPKVVRSSQGSIFHLAIKKANLQEMLHIYKEKGFPIYGTSLQNGVSYKEIKPSTSFVLIMGNEGSGVGQDLLAKTDQNLYIPIYGGAESLNVGIATGILLYHLRG